MNKIVYTVATFNEPIVCYSINKRSVVRARAGPQGVVHSRGGDQGDPARAGLAAGGGQPGGPYHRGCLRPGRVRPDAARRG